MKKFIHLSKQHINPKYIIKIVLSTNKSFYRIIMDMPIREHYTTIDIYLTEDFDDYNIITEWIKNN
jgi:hypothetical protein